MGEKFILVIISNALWFASSDSIDAGELRKLLRELRLELSEDEFDALFASLDSDGGGEIDFEEFYACEPLLLTLHSLKNYFQCQSFVPKCSFSHLLTHSLMLTHTFIHSLSLTHSLTNSHSH